MSVMYVMYKHEHEHASERFDHALFNTLSDELLCEQSMRMYFFRVLFTFFR